MSQYKIFNSNNFKFIIRLLYFVVRKATEELLVTDLRITETLASFYVRYLRRFNF